MFSAGIVIPVRSLATPLLIPEYGEWSMFSAVVVLPVDHFPSHFSYHSMRSG